MNLKPLFGCKGLGKSFDSETVIRDISFSIHQGEKIGLVGPNGSGKTSLLKIIAGLMQHDAGVIDIAKAARVEYLAQVHENIGKSGGETAKRILMPMMASDADLFLLDEPTNDLDLDGLEALEAFVQRSPKAFLIVSHDREFLDRTVSRIIELDDQTRSSVIYDGNYSSYREQREARLDRMWNEYRDKSEEARRLKDSVVQKIEWKGKIEQERKNAKNLPMHEREKPAAAYLRDKEGRMGRRARIIKDRLEEHAEKTVEVVKPSELQPLRIRFEQAARGGTKVFEVVDAVKRSIGPVSFSVQYGDRLIIQGKNGSGKTTLIQMLLGETGPDSGIIERGVEIHIGYLAQNRWNRESGKTALEEFEAMTGLEAVDCRRILNRFRISANDVFKPVSSLSPGEYSRLMIASLAARMPNCIILDEPTNHLDLEVLEELERALIEFDGTLILASHDRYFVNKMRITRTFSMDDLASGKS